MRLIDAEKLIESCEFHETEMDAKNAPTVDAIPVEWLEERINGAVAMEHAMWSRLLEMWRKENGNQ